MTKKVYNAYDFDKAKSLIEANKNKIISAELGTLSDWRFTADEVWSKEDGYLIELNADTFIGGIQGSSWDEPTLRMCFGDGMYKEVSVSKDVFENDMDAYADRRKKFIKGLALEMEKITGASD
ncbi:hypothetical protein ACRYI5_03370 [Furfurilactobacillus sp. WILCCON 0119]